jgi:GTPase SAR1 family protein
MALPNIFTEEVTNSIIGRINNLDKNATPAFGKMGVSQMLAHCCVTYEMLYENIHAKPNAIMRFILKNVVKKIVVSEQAFKRNSKTAPQFIIKEDKNFEEEKARLVNYINKTKEMGEAYFDNKISDSFGALTKQEWNNLFYKHLDHHLAQFNV